MKYIVQGCMSIINDGAYSGSDGVPAGMRRARRRRPRAAV